QSLITLAQELKKGNRPDLTLFYEPINDVYAAYQSGKTDLTENHAQIASKLENERVVLDFMKWVFHDLYFVINTIRGQWFTSYKVQGIDSQKLADDVADVYLNNIHLVKNLAKAYGFRAHFFLQPVFMESKKAFTWQEERIRPTLDGALVE